VIRIWIGPTVLAEDWPGCRHGQSSAAVERDTAGQTLDDWWGELRAVARVALKGRADLLGALGM